MRIETIAAAFAEYEQRVLIPADYGGLNRREARFSFYAGARSVMKILGEHLESSQRVTVLRNIVSELEHFIATEVAAEAEAEAKDAPEEPE